MGDRVHIGLGLLALLFSSLACNAFAGRANTLPPPPIATATSSVGESSTEPNFAPTATFPVDTPMEDVQGSLRILVDLNIRSGPGVSYDRVGFLLRERRVTVIGRDPQSGWWRIQCPEDAEGDACWVSGGSQFTLLESTD